MKTTLNFLIMAMLMAIMTGCHKHPIIIPDPGTKPTIITQTAREISQTGAYANGFVSADGGHSIIVMGIWIATHSNPTSADTDITSNRVMSVGAFTIILDNLSPNTTYYYKAYGTNSVGTASGNEVVFTTLSTPAELTASYTNLSLNSVDINGEVKSNQSVITETGVCYSTNHNPTVSDSKVVSGVITGTFTSSLNGLSENTKYYARAYAVTNSGTLYSPEAEVWTYALMDIDGNGYHSVTIGTQTWTLENFKSIHYLNGDEIPNVTDNTVWSQLTTGARCYYNNDRANYEPVYGCLYNWYVANDSRGLAPSGWRLPKSDEVWKLAQYLGDNATSNSAGGEMKEAGTVHWQEPNTGATNSSGFTALPGGGRCNSYSGELGYFTSLTMTSAWWTKDEYSPVDGWHFYIDYNNAQLAAQVAASKSYGLNIRLIKLD